MPIEEKASRYGAIAIALHWLSTAAILVAVPAGFATALLPFVSGRSGPAVPFSRVHVCLGILILLLTLTRLVWRFFDNRPGEPPGQPHWQVLVARAVHWLLYGLLIVLPVSGIGLIIFSGAIPVLLTQVPGPLPAFFKFWPSVVHSLAAFTLIGLLVIHIAAVLYHQCYKRDGLLARMGVKIGKTTTDYGDR